GLLRGAWRITVCALLLCLVCFFVFFFFQAEDGIRDRTVTGVQTCALPILTAAVQRSLQTVPPEKLVLGMPLYGYEWETLNTAVRSEERRVGKECRCRRLGEH